MRKVIGASWIWLMRGRRRKPGAAECERSKIGVLTFEVASIMTKAVLIWHSLSPEQIVRLRDEVLGLEGVRKLVSNDDDFLLGLAVSETMNSVDSLAHAVARLGMRCADPVLQRFENVFAELIMNNSDQYGLVYSAKKMQRKVKKMERFISTGASLYQELEVLAELEQCLRRMQMAPVIVRRESSLLDFKRKVVLQRQTVKCLRDLSLWNRTYEYTAHLLARSLFTIVDRIKLVFGFHQKHSDISSKNISQLSRSFSVNGVIQSSVHPSDGGMFSRFASGPINISHHKSCQIARYNGTARTRKQATSSIPFKGCMVGGNSSPVLESCIPSDAGSDILSSVIVSPGNRMKGDESELPINFSNNSLPLVMLESRRKLLNAPPSTLGSAALALHYANVIVVIEKLAASPRLIGHDVRDDLYGMLPMSIRGALRTRLKSYAKNLASSVYDPDLAADWSDAMAKILEWLAPLAHNMIKWQSDRNFEQHHLVCSTNVLLLQTLYYANQAKTEAAITELLVGLNYLWRFSKELDEKPILECASSINFDDYSENKV